eukprot:scaffold287_cov337-Pavlova_lutheri.AAC.189
MLRASFLELQRIAKGRTFPFCPLPFRKRLGPQHGSGRVKQRLPLYAIACSSGMCHDCKNSRGHQQAALVRP